MRNEIRERIEAVRRGEVPEGYVVENHQLRPVDWGYDKIGKHLIEYDEYSNDTECYPLTTSSRQGLMLQSEYYGDQRYVETAGGFHIVPEGYITYRHMSDDDVFKFNVNNMGTPVLVSPEYPVFTTDGDLNKTILIEYFNGMKEFRAFCSAQKKGSTRTRMYFGRLGEFSMPIPTAAEQRRIAEVLEACDRAIRLKQELIDEKRKQKQSLMNRLLLPNSIDHIPGTELTQWKKVTLFDCCRRKGEYGLNAPAVDFSPNLPQYIRITDIDDDGRYMKEEPVSVDVPDAENYYLVPGDLLFVRTGATTGKAYRYLESDGLLVYAGFLIRFSVDLNICDDYFIYSQFQTQNYWNWVKTMSARSGQPGINAEEYSSYSFWMPEDINEQHAIADILKDIDNDIHLLQLEVKEWQKKKKALMQLLLTGLVRVNA